MTHDDTGPLPLPWGEFQKLLWRGGPLWNAVVVRRDGLRLLPEGEGLTRVEVIPDFNYNQTWVVDAPPGQLREAILGVLPEQSYPYEIRIGLPIAVLNTAILTATGDYEYKSITLEEARSLIHEAEEIDSAIGHVSTAEILTSLLGEPILMNRQNFQQKTGQVALVFKLRGRPPEGQILSAEQIEEIGYGFHTLTKMS